MLQLSASVTPSVPFSAFRLFLVITILFPNILDSFKSYPVAFKYSRLQQIFPSSITSLSSTSTSTSNNSNLKINAPLSESEITAAFIKHFDDSLEEVTHPVELKQEPKLGEIPEFLIGGVLIRNGPACFGDINKNQDDSNNKKRYDHVFDGLAKLTRYEFSKSGGTKQSHSSPHNANTTTNTSTNNKVNVLFSTKFVRSKLHNKVILNQQSLPPHAAVGKIIPPLNRFEKGYLIGSTILNGGDNDNVVVNIAQIGKNGKWVCTTDGPAVTEFDIRTLDTLGGVKYKNGITSWGGMELLSTAHPQYNKFDDCLYNYYMEVRPLSKSNMIHIVKINDQLERTVIGSVEAGDNNIMPYIHDFSLTPNYAVLVVSPVNMPLSTMLNGEGFMHQVEWLGASRNTKIHVFDIHQYKQQQQKQQQQEQQNKQDGDQGISSGNKQKNNILLPKYTFEAPPMFLYHHVNCYESSSSSSSSSVAEELVLDVTGYDTPGIATSAHAFAIRSNMMDAALRSKQEKDGRVYRYRLLSSSSSSFITPTILPMIDSAGLEYTGEMARLDDALKGSAYRYSYSMTGFTGAAEGVDICDNLNIENARGGFMKWAIVKRDHVTAERIAKIKASSSSSSSSSVVEGTQFSSSPSALIWSDINCYPSEPIFVKNPASSSSSSSTSSVSMTHPTDSKDDLNKHHNSINNINDMIDNNNNEDDGVLLSEVYDANKSESFLLILDAKTMTELSRCYLGQVRPSSFHGQYIPPPAATGTAISHGENK